MKIKPPNPWLILVLIWVCIIHTQYNRVEAAEIDVTFYGKSWHPESDGQNEENELFAIEYRHNNIGYTLASYVNSHHVQAYMYQQSYYFQQTTNWETLASIGVTTGYKNFKTPCLLEKGDFCGIASVGIQYNKYKLKPRVTVYGAALVFSLSYTF